MGCSASRCPSGTTCAQFVTGVYGGTPHGARSGETLCGAFSCGSALRTLNTLLVLLSMIHLLVQVSLHVHAFTLRPPATRGLGTYSCQQVPASVDSSDSRHRRHRRQRQPHYRRGSRGRRARRCGGRHDCRRRYRCRCHDDFIAASRRVGAYARQGTASRDHDGQRGAWTAGYCGQRYDKQTTTGAHPSCRSPWPCDRKDTSRLQPRPCCPCIRL